MIYVFLLLILSFNATSSSRLSEWYEKNKKKVDETAQDLLNDLLFKKKNKDSSENTVPKPAEQNPPPFLPPVTTLPIPENPVIETTTIQVIPIATTTNTVDVSTTDKPAVNIKETATGGNSNFSWVWAISSAVVIAIICCVIILFRWLPVKENMSIYDEIMLPPVFVRNSAYLHERIEELEYDPRFEVDRHNLEIGSLIGAGNFGAVYEGRLNIGNQWKNKGIFRNNERGDISVAVKTAGDASTLEDIELRKKLLEDELKLMCSVGSHPNIVTLFGAVTRINCDGVLIIMDKCDMGNLHDFLISKRTQFIPQFVKRCTSPVHDDNGYAIPMKTFGCANNYPSVEYETLENKTSWRTDLNSDLTTAHLLSFSMQIAEGMKYLNSAKCVHRDLAARNILLTKEGLCKISDFGLAKRIGYHEYYRSERVRELPERWMAVESLRYRKFTKESDVWSYGILLYEIFSLGGTPYSNLSGLVAEHVLNGIRNEQPQYSPDDIYHHMVKCWSEDPERRPLFQVSAELFMNHLVQASSEIFIAVQDALKNEAVRQKELQLMRTSETRGSHRSIIDLY